MTGEKALKASRQVEAETEAEQDIAKKRGKTPLLKQLGFSLLP